jgi:preprotein translocase subunit Sec61beta
MSKTQNSVPSGMGGLSRFSDEEKSYFKIKRGHVIVLVIVVVLIVLFLHMYGSSMLGLPAGQ